MHLPSRSSLFSGFLLPGILGLLPSCLAQDIPFDVDGGLEGCTVTDNTYNSGGTISVAGWTIKVPKNTQVGFPAAWVPWPEFCADVAFMKGFEVTVVGNSLPLHGPIAAQISLSQFSTSFGRGLISSISPSTIHLSNGPTLRINDPNSVYSLGYTSHPFFTADDQNPSITSFSGFPMCIPRNGSDPLCPMSNRPVLAGGTRQGVLVAPDPMVMAPFVVGDFVEYAGVWVGGEMVVYEMVATNVQILTPEGFPPFIRMEDVLVGVYTADTNAEVAQTRFIGYTSAASGATTLGIYAVTGLDTCTGEIMTRQVSSASLIPGQVRNKFRTGITSVEGDRYGREYVVMSVPQEKVVRTRNGILAGRYVQPVTEWIQPELTTPGLPPIPNDFGRMEWLVKGLGKDEEGRVWGALEPFPQSGVTVGEPVVNECPPAPSPTGTPGGDDPSDPVPEPTTTRGTSAVPTPTPTKDTIRVVSAQWISSGSGTLTVTCTSSNTNNTAVGMLLDTPVQIGLVMTGSQTNPGTWTFSSVKIKQVTSVTCRSKLGGSATGVVAGKKRRRSLVNGGDSG
ncbi:hypothetical protein B0T20DRAFT_450470 [Sordaria brevicollis]|uniref:Uncharacterized protein n=1 Tax=Sordaria brevicollis TaxID=83679 RepID=A0AAE0PK97_SORBR|nr:hypothetical protein B0T20DRAFT_450470 [Sordaria brevicollis]